MVTFWGVAYSSCKSFVCFWFGRQRNLHLTPGTFPLLVACCSNTWCCSAGYKEGSRSLESPLIVRWAIEKNPSCLGYIGDEILPSYMRIVSAVSLCICYCLFEFMAWKCYSRLICPGQVFLEGSSRRGESGMLAFSIHLLQHRSWPKLCRIWDNFSMLEEFSIVFWLQMT